MSMGKIFILLFFLLFLIVCLYSKINSWNDRFSCDDILLQAEIKCEPDYVIEFRRVDNGELFLYCRGAAPFNELGYVLKWNGMQILGEPALLFRDWMYLPPYFDWIKYGL